MEKTYTTEELQEILKLSAWTIRKLIRDGKLQATKVGKNYVVTESEVMRYMGLIPPAAKHAAKHIERQEIETLLSALENAMLDTKTRNVLINVLNYDSPKKLSAAIDNTRNMKEDYYNEHN